MIDLFPPRSKTLDLRQYQTDAVAGCRLAVARIKAQRKSEGGNVILCSPTGSGKTVTAAHFMGRLATATKDRDELERFRSQVMKAVDADTPAEALRTVRAWRALRDEAGA